MPSWGEILKQIDSAGTKEPEIYDKVRREYIQKLAQHTKRNVILYATKWTISPLPENLEALSICEEDIEAFMEVFYGLDNSGLDIILHSPGGSAEAAEAIVKYIRKKFPDSVRVIVPHAAMSAATMIACSANEIFMGKHSFLGPIDPQLILPIPIGITAVPRMVPAQAILDQFKLAQEECKDPEKVGSWYPILPIYGPALIQECKIAKSLSKKLVKEWIEQYMLVQEPDRTKKAEAISEYLLNHNEHLSHERHIDRDTAERIGLKIGKLESDPDFQDLVLSVYHATSITFFSTPAIKLIENHMGRAYCKQEMRISMAVPTQKPDPSQSEPLHRRKRRH